MSIVESSPVRGKPFSGGLLDFGLPSWFTGVSLAFVAAICVLAFFAVSSASECDHVAPQPVTGGPFTGHPPV